MIALKRDRDRRLARKLLGVELPAGLRQVHAHREQPSRDLSWFDGYVRLDGPPDMLRSIASRWAQRGTEGALGRLPANWHPTVPLDWWQPDAETPERDAWAARYGVAGTLIAKLEGDSLYVKVHDTGRTPDN